MVKAKCSWYVYNESGDCTGMCGAQATAIFSKANPRTGPKEPTVLTFPRCTTHDTPSIRRAAGEQGYDVEVIDE